MNAPEPRHINSDAPIIRQRIAALRAVLLAHQLDACIVPSADPHLSEYLPEHWQGRQWLSGFTGSAGTLVVTADHAGLWVDSRYWEQAAQQLAGTGIEVMRIAALTQPGHGEWLAAHLTSGSSVAVDAQVLALGTARALEAVLKASGIGLHTDLDLLGEIWPDRPELPRTPIREHDLAHATRSRADKLALVRNAMSTHQASHHVLSTLDDIAWILNLRGADVSYNPVFMAHLLVDAHAAQLFIHPEKVPQALAQALGLDGVQVKPYEQIHAALGALPKDARLLIDPRRITLGIRQAVGTDVTVIEAINPSTLAKSRKTAAEAAHVRQAMERDGAALCEFFAWLEDALGKETITELTIDEHITAARARQADYVSPSFATIAGFNANGALPHYRATPEAHATITGDGLLLIDSGGQYLCGTTDITRVVAIGTPSAAQRRDCTLVLKGVIALSSTRFPRGTRSPLLDSLARAPIWNAGVDYGHGTGHGVGYFLNVHEGPQSISPHAVPEAHTAMEEGMITSIEPGIYRPGQWGVRIENLVLNEIVEDTAFGSFLGFETLTLCPIDRRCLNVDLLHDHERVWLDSYHAEVRERLTPHVRGRARDWLEANTRPL